jgi:hypothetical protein
MRKLIVTFVFLVITGWTTAGCEDLCSPEGWPDPNGFCE